MTDTHRIMIRDAQGEYCAFTCDGESEEHIERARLVHSMTNRPKIEEIRFEEIAKETQG